MSTSLLSVCCCDWFCHLTTNRTRQTSPYSSTSIIRLDLLNLDFKEEPLFQFTLSFQFQNSKQREEEEVDWRTDLRMGVRSGRRHGRKCGPLSACARERPWARQHLLLPSFLFSFHHSNIISRLAASLHKNGIIREFASGHIKQGALIPGKIAWFPATRRLASSWAFSITNSTEKFMTVNKRIRPKWLNI